MSTNISELMFEMEGYGMPDDRVSHLALSFMKAGRDGFVASMAELAGRRNMSEVELEEIAATLVARSYSRSDVVAVAASESRTTDQ